MEAEVTIYLIFNMNAFLSAENIRIINEQNGTNYPEEENNITYQMLYDSREEIGSQRGYFQHLKSDNSQVWVLPDLYYGIDSSESDPSDMVQVSESDYIKYWLPKFIIEEL